MSPSSGHGAGPAEGSPRRAEPPEMAAGWGGAAARRLRHRPPSADCWAPPGAGAAAARHHHVGRTGAAAGAGRQLMAGHGGAASGRPANQTGDMASYRGAPRDSLRAGLTEEGGATRFSIYPRSRFYSVTI